MQLDKSHKLQMTALVVMRVLIGWHFLYEGVAKMMKGGWTSKGFLLQSKWIFAPMFHWMAGNDTMMTIVDQMNIWGLIFIGLGLIVGAFTRIASWAGMALILLYYVCNPPLVGLHYSIPMEGNYLIVNKNLVEMAALFVIAVTNTGHFLGFDIILNKLFKKK